MSDALIRVENVSKIYGSGAAETKALAHLSLEVEKGCWAAIMGPSGHGKSTLLQLIGGLDRPTSGRICVNGNELTKLAPAELADMRARTVGFVFQFFNLLPHLTAVENVELALWLGGTSGNGARSRAMDLLASVSLVEKADAMPGELSGGQQQRVAVARALANDPEILLMDEPTGNLDSASEADLLNLLKRLHEQGRTIVMVTHSQDVAAHAQRVIHVRDGRVVDAGA